MPSLIPDAAAFERRLAGLPVVKHRAHEVVLTAGSKTGRLLFLRSGAVEVIKDGEKIANEQYVAARRLTRLRIAWAGSSPHGDWVGAKLAVGGRRRGPRPPYSRPRRCQGPETHGHGLT